MINAQHTLTMFSRCAGLVFDNSHTLVTKGCDNPLVPVSTTCIIKCKDGYGLHGLNPSVVSASCGKEGKWHFNGRLPAVFHQKKLT